MQGVTDRYRDIAEDLQYQFIGEYHLITVLATYINEHQRLNASVADQLSANVGNALKTFRFSAEYNYQRRIGGSIGYFSTTGSADAVLYAAAPVTGSGNNRPDSSGYIAEINYLPWLNAKLQLQYIGYEKFNGLGANYDGAGRNASNNDTLYLLLWLAF